MKILLIVTILTLSACTTIPQEPAPPVSDNQALINVLGDILKPNVHRGW